MTVYEGSVDPSERNNSRTRVVEWIPDGSRVLEVGCATGFMAEYLTRERGCTVIGVEKDPTAAAVAAGRCAHVIVGDIEDTGTIDRCAGAYDVIALADVIEHLRAPDDALRRLVAYLVPGGRVLASIPNVAHWSIRWRLLAGRWDYQDRGILDRTHLRFFTRRTAAALFRSSGLSITRTAGVYGFPGVFYPPDRLQAAIAARLPGVFMIQFILEGVPVTRRVGGGGR